MNIRKHATTGLLTIGLLVTLAASLEADDMAYMLGTAALGVENPLGIVDLNTGVFTLIGNMGSGGYDGLAVANGVLYTEQNGLLYSVNTSNANLTLIGGLTGNNLATFGSTTTGLYGLAGTGSFEVATLFSINPGDGRRHGDWADRRQRHTQRSRLLCEAFRRFQHAVHGVQQQSLHHQYDNRRGHAGGNYRQ